MNAIAVKALTFDVFGTVVDWRTGVARHAREVAGLRGTDADWEDFADAWRALYQPKLEEIRSGARPWVKLDVLHRESLAMIASKFGLGELSPDDLDLLNLAWHRLDPWPDGVEGLSRLRSKFIVAPMSNGNVSLIVDMAKRAGLVWDAVLGAETAGAYKPQPEVYLSGAAMLSLEPGQVMLVAAHSNDLEAARSCGLRTAFVKRPAEYGPKRASDDPRGHAFDLVANDFLDLATQLNC